MKKALFYPSIDPNDDILLLNSLLYWDEISTIVPESIEEPYKNTLSSELFSLGVLKPERINTESIYVKESGYDLITLFEENKIGELLVQDRNQFDLVSLEKISPDLARTFEYSRMYPEKMPSFIRGCLNNPNQKTVLVEKNFANLYMTLLAKKIALNVGATPFTNQSIYHDLSIDHDFSKNSNQRRTRYDRLERDALGFGSAYQGMAITSTLEMFKLSKNISPEKIMKFKEKYKDELYRFRNAIENIIPEQIEEMSATALINNINEKVKQNIIPAISDLKNAFKGSAISLLPSSLSLATTMSIPATGYLSLTNMSKPEALGISLAVYLATSLFSLRKTRAEALKDCPYSYLFHINQKLS